MNLIRLHRIVLNALVLIPFGALVAGGEMNLVVLALVLVSMVVGWFWTPRRWTVRDRWRLDSMAVLALLGLTIVRLAVGGWFRIEPLVDLVLLMVAIKLLQRRTPRDSIQLMALSFLLLTAASAFVVGLAFAVAFLAYMVLATLCLVTQHFYQELSEHHTDELPRFRLSKGFVGGVVGIAAAVILFSTVFFISFPRMGFGLFNRVGRSGLMTSGFDEEVSLGEHGTVADDQTIVMRVRVSSGVREIEPEALLWRGLSYDHYNGQRWSRRLQMSGPTWVGPANIYMADARLEVDPASTIVQEVYLEPLDTEILFALPGLAGVSFPEENPELPRTFWRERIEITSTGEIYLRRARPSAVHYLAYSSPQEVRLAGVARPGARGSWLERSVEGLGEVTRGILGRSGGRQHQVGRSGSPAEVRPHYLQLPVQMTQAFRDLAAEIVDGATGPRERAILLERYLEDHYQYTTDLPPVSEENPVESFLFETRRGHCEYFATAMTLLARQVGLPARLVNGFSGGDWNRFGGFYAVRQSHAHSWVEVWLPGEGWVTFDPTPAGVLAARESSGWWAVVRAAVDTVRMWWYEHVVDFDLERQLHAARSVVGLFADEDELMGDLYRLSTSAFRNSGVLFLQMLLWLAFIWVYGRRHQRKRPWSPLDWLLGLVWLALVEGSLIWLWRPSADAGQLVVFGLVVLVSVLAAWVFRGGHGEETVSGVVRRRLRPVSREYLRLVGLLVRSGYDYHPSDTPERLIGQARCRHAPYLAALAETLALYQRCRFGGSEGEDEVHELKKRCAGLRRCIRRSWRSGRGTRRPTMQLGG